MLSGLFMGCIIKCNIGLYSIFDGDKKMSSLKNILKMMNKKMLMMMVIIYITMYNNGRIYIP